MTDLPYSLMCVSGTLVLPEFVFVEECYQQVVFGCVFRFSLPFLFLSLVLFIDCGVHHVATRRRGEIEYPVVPLYCKHSSCALPSSHCHACACARVCCSIYTLMYALCVPVSRHAPGDPGRSATRARFALSSCWVWRKFARSFALRLAFLSLSKPCHNFTWTNFSTELILVQKRLSRICITNPRYAHYVFICLCVTSC